MAVMRHKEAIHSGHFMVSDFEAEAEDEEDIAVVSSPENKTERSEPIKRLLDQATIPAKYPKLEPHLLERRPKDEGNGQKKVIKSLTSHKKYASYIKSVDPSAFVKQDDWIKPRTTYSHLPEISRSSSCFQPGAANFSKFVLTTQIGNDGCADGNCANCRKKRYGACIMDIPLIKLLQSMSMAYRHKLTSPKWNRFRGLRLRWKDKIRLNNVIWRCWHMQFIQGKNRLLCQFANPLEIDHHDDVEGATVVPGKYWKRKLDIIKNEYMRWRLFYHSIYGDDMTSKRRLMAISNKLKKSASAGNHLDKRARMFNPGKYWDKDTGSKKKMNVKKVAATSVQSNFSSAVTTSSLVINQNLSGDSNNQVCDHDWDAMLKSPFTLVEGSKDVAVLDAMLLDEMLFADTFASSDEAFDVFPSAGGSSHTTTTTQSQLNSVTMFDMGGDDYRNATNADFIQPGLPSLQPNLDDLGVVDFAGMPFENSLVHNSFNNRGTNTKIVNSIQAPQPTICQEVIKSQPANATAANHAGQKPVMNKNADLLMPKVEGNHQQHGHVQAPFEYNTDHNHQQQYQRQIQRHQMSPNPNPAMVYAGNSGSFRPRGPKQRFLKQREVQTARQEPLGSIQTNQCSQMKHYPKDKVSDIDGSGFRTPNFHVNQFSNVQRRESFDSNMRMNEGSPKPVQSPHPQHAPVPQSDERPNPEFLHLLKTHQEHPGQSSPVCLSNRVMGHPHMVSVPVSGPTDLTTNGNQNLRFPSNGKELTHASHLRSPQVPHTQAHSQYHQQENFHEQVRKQHHLEQQEKYLQSQAMEIERKLKNQRHLASIEEERKRSVEKQMMQVIQERERIQLQIEEQKKREEQMKLEQEHKRQLKSRNKPVKSEFKIPPPRPDDRQQQNVMETINLQNLQGRLRSGTSSVPVSPSSPKIVGSPRRRAGDKHSVKTGFDALRQLIPSLNTGDPQTDACKISKAALLQKGGDHLKDLKVDRIKNMQEIKRLKGSIVMMKEDIYNLHGLLSADNVEKKQSNNVSTASMYRNYAKEVTLRSNWKYWAFSELMGPLAMSYDQAMGFSNFERMQRNAMVWCDQSCNLSKLRKMVTDELQRLSLETDILENPERFPVQMVTKAATHNSQKGSKNDQELCE